MKAFLLSHHTFEQTTNYAVILEQDIERVITLLKAEIVVRHYSFLPPTVRIRLSQKAIISSGIPMLIKDWIWESNSFEFLLQELPLMTSYPLP